MSDSFATAPRLDSTTLTLRIYPKPPTDHPPSSLRLLLSSSLFYVVSRTPCCRCHSCALTLRRPTNYPRPSVFPPPPRPTACLPACGACFPIPHSTVVVVVARTLREKVTSRSRVSQDPANPSWYKIAPSGSHVVVAVVLEGTRRRNERRREIGIPYGSVRFDTVDCGGCSWLTDIVGLCAVTRRRSTNASRVGESPIVEA